MTHRLIHRDPDTGRAETRVCDCALGVDHDEHGAEQPRHEQEYAMANKHTPRAATTRRGDRVVEAKVKTSTAVATLTGLLVTLLATYVFGGDVPPVWAQVVQNIVGAVVPGVLTFIGGWLSKHTPVHVTVAPGEEPPRGV